MPAAFVEIARLHISPRQNKLLSHDGRGRCLVAYVLPTALAEKEISSLVEAIATFVTRLLGQLHLPLPDELCAISDIFLTCAHLSMHLVAGATWWQESTRKKR